MGQEQLCRPSTGEVGNLSELLPTHIGTRLQTNREDRDAVPRSIMSLLKNHGRRIVPGEVRLVSRGLKKFDGHAHVSVVVQITAYNLLMLQRLRQLMLLTGQIALSVLWGSPDPDAGGRCPIFFGLV